MRQRAILCVQGQHFYARVASLRSGGELDGRQVGVTRDGWVLDLSPEAAAAGMRAGMRVRQARRWFPEASFVPAVDEQYPEYARPLLEICASYTPLVDPETPARVFLDVTGCETLYGSPAEVAEALARRIPRETGFACAVGGGRNRLVASLAVSVERIIPAGEERDFLAPLALRLLGDALDPDLAEWLELRSVNTFGDAARLPAGMLWRNFGVTGEKLARLAVGEDPSPVRAAYPPRALEAHVECDAPAETEEQVAHYLTHLAFAIAGRLGKTHESARRYRLSLTLPVRDSAEPPSPRGGSEPLPDGGGRAAATVASPCTVLSQAVLLPTPISSGPAIYDVLLRLFRRLSPEAPPLAAAVAAEEIAAGEAFQTSLFPELDEAPAARKPAPMARRTPTVQERERDRRLAHTLGLLAMRYGPTMVTPGCHLWETRRPRFIDRVGVW